MDTEQTMNMPAQTQNTPAQTQEEAFREKAPHYLKCFIDQCPQHEGCLRWLVGQYAGTNSLAQTGVNPRNPSIGGEHCTMFRKSQRVVMKRGFTHVYHDMPGYMERGIRQMLIATWGRKQYFEMRRGDRLITPDEQDDMQHACRHHGWTGPIEYDGEAEDWLW